MSTLQKVLDYWFSTPNDYQKWFFSGSSLDNYIKIEFEPLLLEVLDNNKKYNPKNTKEILAKIILLDQFSRHMYRNSDKAYALSLFLYICLENWSNRIIFANISLVFFGLYFLLLSNTSNKRGSNSILI